MAELRQTRTNLGTLKPAAHDSNKTKRANKMQVHYQTAHVHKTVTFAVPAYLQDKTVDVIMFARQVNQASKESVAHAQTQANTLAAQKQQKNRQPAPQLAGTCILCNLLDPIDSDQWHAA